MAENADVNEFEIDLESGYRYANSRESPLAWLPGDRLVYTVPSDDRVVVYITKPASLEIDKKITLPDLYPGEVTSLDTSPDGTRLLMGYNPESGVNKHGVLLLDLETLAISVPAIEPMDVNTDPLGDNIKGKIFAPQWSSDGKWIMVVTGNHTSVINGGNAWQTWPMLCAVPADKSRTVLTQDEPTDAIAIRLVRPSKPSDGPVADWYSSEYYDWVN